MASVFRLVLAIVPAVASGVNVVKSRVGSGAWSQAATASKSQLASQFWRTLRKELEGKKLDLAETSQSTRRDLLWHAVREVDDKFHQKYVCEINDGTTYAKEASFVQGQTAYSKAHIESARECALMCAADSMAGQKQLMCKSFKFNQTAMECRLFNFGHPVKSTLVKDDCCTTGPPCNLNSVREEIQKAFQKAMHPANQLKMATKELFVDEKHHTEKKVVKKVADPEKSKIVEKNGSKMEFKAKGSDWPYVQPGVPVMPQPAMPPSYPSAAYGAPAYAAPPNAVPPYAAPPVQPYVNAAPAYGPPAYTASVQPYVNTAPVYTAPRPLVNPAPAYGAPAAPTRAAVPAAPTKPATPSHAAPVARTTAPAAHTSHHHWRLPLVLMVFALAVAGVVSSMRFKRDPQAFARPSRSNAALAEGKAGRY